MKLAITVFAVLAYACNVDAWDSPRQLETPQTGTPCGAAYHPCFDFNESGAPRDTDLCCPNGTACGGAFPNVGPAGYCEPTEMGAARDAGADARPLLIHARPAWRRP